MLKYALQLKVLNTFINKYWNDVIQERVRNELEFGRYHAENGMNMIQYLERKLLENRQLIPPIPDKYLIRKISKHYPHEVQVAIITRGVVTIDDFEQVLLEFISLRNDTREANRVYYEGRRERKPWARGEEERERAAEQGRANESETRSSTQHYPKRQNRFKNENDSIPSTSNANSNKINTAMPKN